jgi:hypothetical protein
VEVIDVIKNATRYPQLQTPRYAQDYTEKRLDRKLPAEPGRALDQKDAVRVGVDDVRARPVQRARSQKVD